jgi:tRNA threonylcarbamoyladenosine biosynthesis protein TsaE
MGSVLPVGSNHGVCIQQRVPSKFCHGANMRKLAIAYLRFVFQYYKYARTIFVIVKQFEMSVLWLDQLPALANSILKFAQSRKVFLFEGEMGAGKTTLIKEMCRQLGSVDSFSSPTYAIANEYACTSGKIYHLDLYRLKNVEEALSMGIEDYLDGNGYCFIEWPGIVSSLIPADAVHVHLKTDGEVRNVSIFTEPNT